MSELNQFIERDFKSSYCTQSLKSYDSHLIAASPAMISGVGTRWEYTSWSEEFNDGYNELLKTFETQGKSINADYIRSLEVEQRWQAERFFATEGKEGAREVLGYNDISNGEDVFRNYDDEQWETLTTSFKRPRIDPNDSNSTIEGHHVNDVSNNSGLTPEGYESTGGPNNIRLMSRDAHVNSETYGHGGNTQNPTSGEANEIDRTFNNVVDQNHSNNIDEIQADGTGIAAGVAGAAFLIHAGYLLFNSRDSAIPKTEILKQGLATGMKFGTGSLLYSTGYSAFTNSLYTLNVSDHISAASFDLAPGDLAIGLGGDTVTDLIAIGGGAGLAKFGFSTWKNISDQGFTSNTLKNIGSESIYIAKQEVAWLGYGMGVDLLAGLMIPDPTGVTQTVVIVSRVAMGLWGFFTGKSEQKKKKELGAKREKERRKQEEKYKEMVEDLKAYYFERLERLKESIFKDFKYSS